MTLSCSKNFPTKTETILKFVYHLSSNYNFRDSNIVHSLFGLEQPSHLVLVKKVGINNYCVVQIISFKTKEIIYRPKLINFEREVPNLNQKVNYQNTLVYSVSKIILTNFDLQNSKGKG